MNKDCEPKILILDRNSQIEEDTLQGVVELYKKHTEFNDEERRKVGVFSVENLKDTIQTGVTFVLALDQNNQEVIGGGRLGFFPRDDKNPPSFWSTSIWTSPNHRRKGVGKKIVETIQFIFSKTKKELKDLSLECGIAIDNKASEQFHKNLGWQVACNAQGKEKIFTYEGKQYRKWEFMDK